MSKLEEAVREEAKAERKKEVETATKVAKPRRPQPKQTQKKPAQEKQQKKRKVAEKPTIDGATEIVEILAHRLEKKKGMLKVRFDNNYVDWCEAENVYEDEPLLVANYVDEYKLYVKKPWKDMK
jgi:hypothetical protein